MKVSLRFLTTIAAGAALLGIPAPERTPPPDKPTPTGQNPAVNEHNRLPMRATFRTDAPRLSLHGLWKFKATKRPTSARPTSTHPIRIPPPGGEMAGSRHVGAQRVRRSGLSEHRLRLARPLREQPALRPHGAQPRGPLRAHVRPSGLVVREADRAPHRLGDLERGRVWINGRPGRATARTASSKPASTSRVWSFRAPRTASPLKSSAGATAPTLKIRISGV